MNAEYDALLARMRTGSVPPVATDTTDGLMSAEDKAKLDGMSGVGGDAMLMALVLG